MHPEKGMIFLGFAKFFRIGSDLILYFAVRFACLDCYASFSSFYSVKAVNHVIMKFRLGIHRRFQFNK
jgi:hypothetical protein